MTNITVLLPVYNAGPPLKCAIESILSQDLHDFEFLIIDDASTDKSAKVIREYERSDRRIRVIYHKENRGLAATLTEGLHESDGEYIARMDQDDQSLPQRLGIQYLFMKNRPDIAVAGSHVFLMGKDRSRDHLVQAPASPEEVALKLKSENCIFHPSVVMRRAQVLEAGGYRPQFKNSEDYDLWLRVSRNHRIANIPIPLLRYRLSTAGMTLSRKWEQLYYFFLAQAANEDPSMPFNKCEEEAKRRHSAIDRSYFLGAVFSKTVEDLIRLGFLKDAFVLGRQYSKYVACREIVMRAFHAYYHWSGFQDEMLEGCFL